MSPFATLKESAEIIRKKYKYFARIYEDYCDKHDIRIYKEVRTVYLNRQDVIDSIEKNQIN